jgi:hypothetical protein
LARPPVEEVRVLQLPDIEGCEDAGNQQLGDLRPQPDKPGPQRIE